VGHRIAFGNTQFIRKTAAGGGRRKHFVALLHYQCALCVLGYAERGEQSQCLKAPSTMPLEWVGWLVTWGSGPYADAIRRGTKVCLFLVGSVV
jgi:hypothetical protein